VLVEKLTNYLLVTPIAFAFKNGYILITKRNLPNPKGGLIPVDQQIPKILQKSERSESHVLLGLSHRKWKSHTEVRDT